jgi:hypothetical protein
VLLTYHHLLSVTLEGSKGDKMLTSLATLYSGFVSQFQHLLLTIRENT